MVNRYYYDAVGSKGFYSGPFWGRIYKFDDSGNRIITVWRSTMAFSDPVTARDAALEYAEENEIDVELG